MQINSVKAIYFSATGNTNKIIHHFCDALELPAEYLDITDNKIYSCEIDSETLTVIGVPSFGGRVPTVISDSLKSITGMNTPAFILTTYGNREFEDTLTELKSIVEDNGFVVTGGAAFIAKHSIVTDIASNRPDNTDLSEIENFAEKFKTKLLNSETVSEAAKVKIKGNENFREFNGLPFAPQPTKRCNSCGLCETKCPVNAIDKSFKADVKTCITCMRCVSICPQSARKLPGPVLKMMELKLHKLCKGCKPNELFL